MTPRHRLLRVRPGLLLLTLVVLIAACAAPDRAPDTDEVRERVNEAQSMLADDRPLAAARIYSELAADATGDDVARWRLEAVELLFDRGYPEAALEEHRELDALDIPAGLELRKRVTNAQAAVARQQGAMALNLLPPVTRDQEHAVQARIHATRARALGQIGEPERALSAWIDAGEVYLDADDRAGERRNHESTWNLLDGTDREILEDIADHANTRTERGWAQLALAERRARSGQQPVDVAFSDWRTQNPQHPAADEFAETLRERVIDQLTYPERIDVLLPLTGALAQRARAVRDGIVTSFYRIPDYIRRPELVFHDVGEEGDSVDTAYDRAVEAGAGFVIGPLERDAVTRLSRMYELPVPILSLNYLGPNEANPPSGFYQFGLAPEDEARQAAEAAIQNNRFNAVTFTPTNDWGDRMADAFAERYQELGGVVVSAGRYNPRQSDYRQPIQSLLNIGDSYARLRQLRSTVGNGDLRFEPRRRDDVEAIFLAAQPQQARLAKPQLDFHRIGNIPVYATSHVFTGTVDPDSDWDMNGLFFTEMPWILDEIVADDRTTGDSDPDLPASHARFPRLFALGADALDVVPLVEQMRAGRGDAHRGRTGRLSMTGDGRIQRELLWARFERGRPQPVPTPALTIEGMIGEDIRERADGED